MPLAIAILTAAPLPVTLVSVTILSVVPEPVTAMVPVTPRGDSVIFEARSLLLGMLSAPAKVSLYLIVDALFAERSAVVPSLANGPVTTRVGAVLSRV